MDNIWALLINNADKLGAAIAFMIVTAVLVFYLAKIFNGMTNVIDRISERAEAQAQREDVFQTRLLDLHTKTVGNNDKLVSLLEISEKAAIERTEAQLEREKVRDARDDKQAVYIEQLNKVQQDMVAYLPVMSETKAAVDTIHATQLHTEGLVTQVGASMADTVREAAAVNLEGYKQQIRESYKEVETTVKTSFELIEGAVKKIHERLDNIPDAKELEAIASGLNTLLTVAQNTYQLVQQTQSPIPLEAVSKPKAVLENDAIGM